MSAHKTYLNWSSGKDAALALYYLRKEKTYSVEYLITSVNTYHDRVTMHGLRRALLEQQLNAVGIPHGTVELPEFPDNLAYGKLMGAKVKELKTAGFEYAAFGDIFLEDLKKYREQQLAPLEIKAVFPLWKKDSKQLVYELIALGFKTIVVCVDAAVLDKSFAGRIVDKDFINDLPEGVDPCGENGEFHTFCFDGPIFKHPVKFSVGETVYREYDHNGFKSGFWFCDLLHEDFKTS